MKKTCPRCKARVSERAAVCRHCRYAFPEKSSPWAAGPALGAGFPLILIGVMTLFFAGNETPWLIGASVIIVIGGVLAFHPR